MTRRQGSTLVWLALLMGALTTPAWADDPKFTYGKAPDAYKKVTLWTAAVQAGLVLNTGNANSFTFNAGATASMTHGWNRVQLDVNGSYARATTLTALDLNGNGTLDNQGEISNTTATSAELWNVKLRYDRFLSSNNSIYATGLAGGNRPAGIVAAGGAQVGYSRQAFKSSMHLIAVEIGYDYTYQDNVAPPNLNIHSGRLYAGYSLTLSKDIAILTGIEVLSNFNSLPAFDAAVPGAKKTVDAFGATRINSSAALNARIWKNIAFQLSFLARYTTDPAALPALSLPYAATFVPRAQRLDTVTSLSLVVTLL